MPIFVPRSTPYYSYGGGYPSYDQQAYWQALADRRLREEEALRRQQAYGLARRREAAREEALRREFVRRQLLNDYYQNQEDHCPDRYPLHRPSRVPTYYRDVDESLVDMYHKSPVSGIPSPRPSPPPEPLVERPPSSKGVSIPITSPPSRARLDEAATLIQSTFRQHHIRQKALKSIDAISRSFQSFREQYQLPAHLDFESSGALSYTANNAPVHAYEHSLGGLLTKLDAIESGGDVVVRKTRKDLVRNIEEELESLDRRKVDLFAAQRSSAVESSSSDGISAPVYDQQVEEEINIEMQPDLSSEDIVIEPSDIQVQLGETSSQDADTVGVQQSISTPDTFQSAQGEDAHVDAEAISSAPHSTTPGDVLSPVVPTDDEAIVDHAAPVPEINSISSLPSSPTSDYEEDSETDEVFEQLLTPPDEEMDRVLDAKDLDFEMVDSDELNNTVSL